MDAIIKNYYRPRCCFALSIAAILGLLSGITPALASGESTYYNYRPAESWSSANPKTNRIVILIDFNRTYPKGYGDDFGRYQGSSYPYSSNRYPSTFSAPVTTYSGPGRNYALPISNSSRQRYNYYPENRRFISNYCDAPSGNPSYYGSDSKCQPYSGVVEEIEEVSYGEVIGIRPDYPEAYSRYSNPNQARNYYEEELIELEVICTNADGYALDRDQCGTYPDSGYWPNRGDRVDLYNDWSDNEDYYGDYYPYDYSYSGDPVYDHYYNPSESNYIDYYRARDGYTNDPYYGYYPDYDSYSDYYPDYNPGYYPDYYSY